MSSRMERMPEHVRELPVETQIAVLYERVGALSDEVHALKRALWTLVFTVLGGMILTLFSIAAGWIGRHP